MQKLHYSFCCIAHIFRMLKKQRETPGQARSALKRKENTMFEVLKTRISTWRRYNRTVSELNALTNRELADLGIMRTDIRSVAREAAR